MDITIHASFIAIGLSLFGFPVRSM